MLHRFRRLRLAAVFALCTGIGGASATVAKAADMTAYHIENDKQQVTIKDAAGKTLTTRHVATPTIRTVVSVWWEDDKSAPPRVSLILEDANGLRLWDAPIAPPRHFKSPGSIQCQVKVNSDTPGTELDVTFAQDKEKPKPDAAAEKKPDAFSMVFVIGASGRPVSMDAIDGNGEVHHAVMDMSAEGVTMTAPDGTKAHIGASGFEGKAGGTIEINGTKIAVTTVEKEGKQYFSFPWNGHQILIEDGCTFTMDGDSNITVNAPADKAKK